MRTTPRILVVAVLLAACTAGGSTTTTPDLGPTSSTTTAAIEPLYLMLMWHQHQPLYPKDADGIYTRPWVRVHATKDYWDMAALVGQHPDIEVTFNLTPVLLLQLEDLANGAKDAYWVVAESPADTLTVEDQRFIAERFFDINPTIVRRFPRLRELADERAELGVDGVLAAWDDTDFRDLQVLFNLAWMDPGFLAEPPLSALVEKERGFSEEDKEVLFEETLRIIRDVIPIHSRLWEEGRIEVTTTPLAHPILPLLGDTDLASVGDPAGVRPENRFREIADADQQVVRGLDTAERLLGRRPTGMWPGEGSIAQLIMNLFSKNGVRWVATGEDVLAQTLGLGSFERDGAGHVTEAETLYRPYSAQINQRDPVAVFFRDIRLSDQIGFEYSGMDAGEAVSDFMSRLRHVRDEADMTGAARAGQPVVVSVILDGENAWEHYESDGHEFLEALYTAIEDADWLETITPSQYLDNFGDPEPIRDIYPASWFQPNYATWIGEDEEAVAWDYLYETRQALRAAERSGDATDAQLASALEKMLFAEGSDWFWWYGSDQDSGNDGYFDFAFRELLGQVYDALGMVRPAFVDIPIIPETPVVADRAAGDLVTIVVDGIADPGWQDAGVYEEARLRWAFDKQHLYLRYDGEIATGSVIYLGAPQGAKTSTTYQGDVLGFGATHAVVVTEDGALLCSAVLDFDPNRCVPLAAGTGPDLVETAVPLSDLGALQAGDNVLVKAALGAGLVPLTGPLALQVPDISDVEVFIDVEDPTGDDHGPGTYTYPTDSVFSPGSYDLTRFQAGTEDEDLVLTFEVASSIGNPWGSPSGLSVQTFDVYVDTDPGKDTGSRLLIPGRNAALETDFGWEYGLTIEGWYPAVYVSTSDGSLTETEPSIGVAVFGDQGKVVVRIPRVVFGEGDPATWGYAVAVLSQEGFPSPGVRRVRDIAPTAAQWLGGGAPNDINHTRIFDLAWPVEGEQETFLADYPSTSSGRVDDLGPDDLPRLPVLMSQ